MIEAQFTTPTGITIQRVAFNVFGNDNIAKYNLHVGDEATVHYGINAREYQGKWYNDVRAYKVTKTSPNPSQGGMAGAQNGQMQAPQQYAQPQQQFAQPQQQGFPPQQPAQYAQQYNPGQQGGNPGQQGVDPSLPF